MLVRLLDWTLLRKARQIPPAPSPLSCPEFASACLHISGAIPQTTQSEDTGQDKLLYSKQLNWISSARSLTELLYVVKMHCKDAPSLHFKNRVLYLWVRQYCRHASLTKCWETSSLYEPLKDSCPRQNPCLHFPISPPRHLPVNLSLSPISLSYLSSTFPTWLH